jgi:hypothetical protein
MIAKIIINVLKGLNGFRKLFMMFLVLVVASSFLATGYITGSEFVDLLKIVTPAYFAANASEHVTNQIHGWLSEKKKMLEK